MASIEKRGNTWRVTVSHTQNGKRVRAKKTFESKKDAQLYALQIEAAKGRGKDISMGEKSFPTFFRNWIDNVKKREVRPGTYRNYTQASKVIDILFDGIQLKNLNDIVVQARIDIYGESHARKTTHELLLKIRTSLKYAYARGLIVNDFGILVKTRGKELPKRNLSLSETDFKKLRKYLLSHHDTDIEVLALLALETGCRRGELLGIKKEDLHNNCIDIRRSIGPNSDTLLKNPQSRRTLTINTEVFNILNERPVLADGYLFEPNGFHQSKELKELLRSLKLPETTFHGLRDTHASFLFSSDKISLDYVSQRLGHSNLMTTQQYYLTLMPEKKHQQDADALKLLNFE